MLQPIFFVMNHSFALLILLFLISNPKYSFTQEYWQQEVNYRMDVRLDDEHHMLHATQEFEYINHSPDTLLELYIHIWPNAYSSGQSELSKQLASNGNNTLLYSSEEDRGYIDSLTFKVNGEFVEHVVYDQKIDIVKLKLPSSLLPGASINVSTPFRVKLPSGRISRLGHIGQSYQITQWYPKPAVYDKNGWNPMPYLNQGEFYSEFGSFDVSITLPANYVVGSTGDLQNASEIKFMNELAEKTAS